MSGVTGSGGGGGVMYIDATAGAVEHCQSMAGQYPDLAEQYEQMATSCQSKLWHQLTIRLLSFTSDPKTLMRMDNNDVGTHAYLALYDRVVLAIENKLKPLRLSQIAANVAHALAMTDVTAAKAILENLLVSKKDNLGVAATLYLQSTLGLLHLQTVSPENLNTTSSKEIVRAMKKTIAENTTLIQEMSLKDPVDQAIVQAAHYQQAMQYHKVVGPPEAFYEQAMHFLSYAPVPTSASSANTNAAGSTDQASPSVKDASTLSASSTTTMPGRVHYPSLAVDLCLAALTGDGVYNLGRVVVDQAPLLELLVDTPHAWLVELLNACANGNVEEFRQLTAKHDAAINQQPALVHRANSVQEKLGLLALVALVFGKASHERQITFQEIAECLHLSSIDQVEWVVMRALSTGLLQGKIDQVQQTLKVTWVLPRVLNPKQMQDLSKRFGEWAVQVSKTKDYMQEQMPTSFALENK